MKLDLPDEHGAAVISIEVERRSRYKVQGRCSHASVLVDEPLAG